MPLIAPTSSDECFNLLAEQTSSFLYCVSVAGVTALPEDLPDFVARIRSKTDLTLAVGFGISNPDMVQGVANLSDGVVVGSAILHAVEAAGKDASTAERAEAVRAKIADLCTGLKQQAGQPPMPRIRPLTLDTFPRIRSARNI